MSLVLSYKFCFLLFHGLLWISLGLVAFLFVTYQKSNQNILLRSLCCMIMLTFITIESSLVLFGPDPQPSELFHSYSIVQVIILNYCFISVQAHSACMMVNNCLLALGWKFGEWEQIFDRTLLFLLVSYGIPMIPTAVLGFNIPKYSQHTTSTFFARVPAQLETICSKLWCLGFAIPGNAATIYLMCKTINLRRKTLEMTAFSQITRGQVCRLLLAMIIYMVLSLGSVVSFFFEKLSDYTEPQDLLAPPFLKSPWTNPNLCNPSHDMDDRLLYFSHARCPGVFSYFPPLLGVGIFLMYGFGTPVKSALRRMSILTTKILQLPKRKLSTLPFDSADMTISDSGSASELEVSVRPLDTIRESPYEYSPSRSIISQRKNK